MGATRRIKTIKNKKYRKEANDVSDGLYARDTHTPHTGHTLCPSFHPFLVSLTHYIRVPRVGCKERRGTGCRVCVRSLLPSRSSHSPCRSRSSRGSSRIPNGERERRDGRGTECSEPLVAHYIIHIGFLVFNSLPVTLY